MDGSQEPGAGARRRRCYFAHFDPDPIVADHVLHYLEALRGSGFTIVFGTPCALGDAERARVAAFAEHVVLRENIGMDFGTWIDLLERHPPSDEELVLLCNDSVYAPIGGLSAWLDRTLETPADFYGAIASGEARPHIQSWFMLFRPAAFRSAAFADLFRPGSITPSMDKTDIVGRFELGMTGRLVEAGFRYHAAYDWRRDSQIAASLPFNPAHLLWDELIETQAAPFLKVELLRYNPAQVAGLGRWRTLVGRFQPALVPMIEADLARRGGRGASIPIMQPRSTLRLKGAPDPIYRRQLRPMLVRDFRTTRARRRVRAGANALLLRAAWRYSMVGRVVKWSVLDAFAAVRRRLGRAN